MVLSSMGSALLVVLVALLVVALLVLYNVWVALQENINNGNKLDTTIQKLNASQFRSINNTAILIQQHNEIMREQHIINAFHTQLLAMHHEFRNMLGNLTLGNNITTTVNYNTTALNNTLNSFNVTTTNVLNNLTQTMNNYSTANILNNYTHIIEKIVNNYSNKIINKIENSMVVNGE